MKRSSRRRFFKTAATGGFAVMLSSTGLAFESGKSFVHQVYFWLKNPGNEEDRRKLIDGLTKLAKMKIIQKHHIGLPAASDRGVVDSTYSVSWLTFFKNKADQDSYQTDPLHLKFVEECSHLWNKVIVYDSEEV